MLYTRDKFYGAVVAVCLALMLLGCSSAAEPAAEDIGPITALEAQVEETVVPELSSTPTELPLELAELTPATTELPTELAEAGTPIVPVSPLREQKMTLSSDSIQPLTGSEEALVAALADLTERTGLPTTEIKLVSMEAVNWSDASLGCPQEGFMYAQVITPGYLIIFEAGGQTYEYHTDQTGNAVLCENGQ